MNTTFRDVEEYIHSFPQDVQEILQKIRVIIKENIPEVSEQISYGMPAYKLYGKPLVYFGAYRHHIGFYATPSGHSEFAEELSHYKRGKGSVQFPIDKPIPFDLISRIVKFRAMENQKKETKSSFQRG
ncbi:MAG: DUF1801 domain-containing protein [Chitinophagaceae bacterium]|nr:DUF1801 domain-containing protein [Chitinophagaceae bacterium]